MPATRSTAKAAPRRAPSSQAPSGRTRSARPAAVKPVAAALQEVMKDPAGSRAGIPLASLASDDAPPVTSFIPLAPSEPAEIASGTAAKAAKTAATGKKAKAASTSANANGNGAKTRKPKLVRDSFTIPKPEYALIEELKLRAAKLGKPVKKSEVLRAGIKALESLSDDALLARLAAVPRVKTGRPAKA